MSLGSIHVMAPISSHKGITKKRQNGILSTVWQGWWRWSGSGGWEGRRNRIIHLNRVRKHLSLWSLYHSPTHITIITTQQAGTKDTPESGVQRESWPGIVRMRIYFFKSFIRLLPSSKNISIIVTILKSICNRHLKLSQGWERCNLPVLPYWPSFDFLKYLPTFKVAFRKWPSYNSFWFWASLWYRRTSCSMGQCDWDGQHNYGLEVVGQERSSLSMFLYHPLLCVHDILDVIGESQQLFPKTDTFNMKFSKSF